MNYSPALALNLINPTIGNLVKNRGTVDIGLLTHCKHRAQGQHS